ncbi:MAG: N,N-dimethylformamidase beta subunit family domain-containing protein [Gemmata sp.]
MPAPTRREALAAPLPLFGSAAPAAGARTAGAAENEKPGTTDWQLTYVKFDAKAKYRQSLIEGYCTRTSAAAGEKLGFCVSADPAAPFTIDVYRMGYYGGTGGRLVKSFGPFDGKPQPVPPAGERRLRECAWEPCVTFAVPKDWLSGVYLAKLSATGHRYQSYCIFIVRDDRAADVCFQCSTNTWQAYNKWPDAHSLYDNDREDKKPLVSGVRASFDRPYAKYPQVTDNPLSLGSGEFLLFEFPFAYWLEQHGYDVTYCANEDVHNSLDTLTKRKAFLSVGHDEYWSRKQYDHCMEAVKRGVNFGFFSGNSCCFVVPMLESSAKVPNRVIERVGRYGGIRPGEEKWMADLPEAAPNESTLIGAQTVTPFNGSGDWICTNPAHWVFAGTGMLKGDRIPGLVGWEFHGDPAKIPGLEVVAAGTTLNGGDKESRYAATIYPGPKGNTVFNASTIFWAQGLSSPLGHWLPYVHNGRPHGPDARVQKITANLLAKWCG